MKLSDAAIGQRVVVVEGMDQETRWTHFERREGTATFSLKYLPVYSLRVVQGRPGLKPRYDSGESRIASEMPASVAVVDAKGINHDWTEAHEGIAIVEMSGWIGFYVNSKLVHKISPHDILHQPKTEVVQAVIAALDDVPLVRLKAEGSPIIPEDLTKISFVSPQ